MPAIDGFSEGDVARVYREYEGLANTAGMLSGLLEDYLQARFNHLLLIYPDNAALELRLGQLANEAAESTFYYFCKILFLLERIEREMNGAHLLCGLRTIEDLQRLINVFIDSIPKDESEGGIDTLRIIAVLGSQAGKSDHRKTVDLPLSTFNDRICNGKLLKTEVDAYRKWLFLSPPSLITGTEVLGSYAKLLSYEINLFVKYRRLKQVSPSERRATRSVHTPMLHELSDTAKESVVAQKTYMSLLGNPMPGRSQEEPELFTGEPREEVIYGEGRRLTPKKVLQELELPKMSEGQAIGELHLHFGNEHLQYGHKFWKAEDVFAPSVSKSNVDQMVQHQHTGDGPKRKNLVSKVKRNLIG